MSKGNMLLGYARGKVGSMVFSRNAGEQIVKSYNSQPRNPRTREQMKQRAQFMCGVKFFTRGVQNLFKFAFEDKKIGESDFNAFMRNNAKRGIYYTRADMEEPTYPAIGDFMMSKGSLLSPRVEETSVSTKMKILCDCQYEGQDWGNVCDGLRRTYGLHNGDFFTVVSIVAKGSTDANSPALEPTRRGAVVWDIKQAIIGENEDTDVSDIFGSNFAIENGNLVVTGTNSILDAWGLCAIASRKTRRGLKTSTSYMTLNEGANSILVKGRDDSFREQVYEWWNTAELAILEGGSVQMG